MTTTGPVQFVLDQHVKLDFYSANALQHLSAAKHVSPLRHIILMATTDIPLIKWNVYNEHFTYMQGTPIEISRLSLIYRFCFINSIK